MEPIVIARIATSRMVQALILSSMGLAALCWYLLTHDFGDNEVRKWMVLPVVLLAFPAFAVTGWQLYRYRGKALWISDGKLFYKPGWSRTVLLSDIKDAVIGDVLVGVTALNSYHERYILVKLRNGGEVAIDIRYLSEPAPVVLARLRDALGLPEPA